MFMFPGPATGLLISRTFESFLQISKKKKSYRRTTVTDMEFPDRDTRIAEAYEAILKLIGNLGNAK